MKVTAFSLRWVSFWKEAARLPSDSWAVLFEDTAKLTGGPRQLEEFINQAEVVAYKTTGGPAEIVYLKQCDRGKKFMQSFFADARGYAIRPDMARPLFRAFVRNTRYLSAMT